MLPYNNNDNQSYDFVINLMILLSIILILFSILRFCSHAFDFVPFLIILYPILLFCTQSYDFVPYLMIKIGYNLSIGYYLTILYSILRFCAHSYRFVPNHGKKIFVTAPLMLYFHLSLICTIVSHVHNCPQIFTFVTDMYNSLSYAQLLLTFTIVARMYNCDFYVQLSLICTIVTYM